MIQQRDKMFFGLIFSFFLCISLLSFRIAHASTPAPAAVGTQILGGQNVTVYNPLTGDETIVPAVNIIGNIVSAILGILGSITLLMFVLGGVMWLTSVGNDTRLKKARDTLVWATLGLFVIFSSYLILNFILGNLVFFFSS